MQITYEIQTDDIFKYAKEASASNLQHNVYAIILVIYTVLFVFADLLCTTYLTSYKDVSVYPSNVFVRGGIGVLIGLVGVVVIVLINKHAGKKASSSGINPLFIEHTITLEPDGFAEETPVNHNFYKWTAVETLKETKNYLAIVVRLTSFYLIPKRSFSDELEMNSFASAVRDYIETNK